MRRFPSEGLLYGGLVPVVGGVGGHLRHEVGVVVAREAAQPFEGVLGGRAHRDCPHHHPARADAASDGAGVDVGDASHPLRSQELVEGGGAQGMAGPGAVLPHDEPRHLHLARLEVALVDAVVADQRVRRHDDLPGVRRVGQHLLVAGHRRVEYDLAERVGRRAKGEALIRRAVFQD